MRFKTNSLLPDPRTLIFYNLLVRLQKTERKQLGLFREGGVGQESPWVKRGGVGWECILISAAFSVK